MVREACEGSKNVKRVLPEARVGGSEDATKMERVGRRGEKATYMLSGSLLTAGHHNPAFDYDEGALAVAVGTLGRLLKLLGSERLQHQERA